MQKLSNRWDYNRSRFTLAVTLTVLLTAVPVFAEWYKDYESAIEMIKKGDSVSAIPRLQAAIAQKNDEGSNIKFYGMKFGDYFPHYYLGLAYFSQKNYEASLREFEASERFGAIHRKNDLYEKMSSVRTLAKAQLVVQNQPQIANNTNNPTIAVPIVTPPPSNNTTTPVTKPEEKKVTELQRETKPVQPEIKPTVIENKPPLEARKEEQKPPPVAVTAPGDTSEEAIKKMVKMGAQKYFEGDYDGAITLLTSAAEINPKEAAAHFLLGCAYASKFMLTGSENQKLLQSASLAFQKLKRISPGYKPRNKAYFSPAVLDLFVKAS